MAQIRKKYYSITAASFIDVNTSPTGTFNTQDINTGPSDVQKIRLIGYQEDIDTARFTQVIADLIYNDIQILATAEQNVEILSEGVFRDVNQEFAVANLETVTYLAQLYPTKIKVSGGQIRKNGETLRKDVNSIPKVGDIGIGSNTILNIDVTGLTVNMMVSNPNIPANAYIQSIGLTSIVISQNATGTALASNIVFSDEQLYIIGGNLPDFTLAGVFPKYRRVLVELDANTGAYNVVVGAEQSKRLPINTQLDISNANSIGLYSLLLFKNSAIDPTLIYSVDKIWEYVGLISGTIKITQAEIDKGFDGTYSIHTQEYEHLRDVNGNLIDWADGQSSVSRPFIGDAYNDLYVFEETQLPQSYDALNSSSPVVIPFVIRNENVNDNYSASATVAIKKIEVGVRNNPAFIGDEGVAVQLVTADTVFDFTANETAKNGSPSTTQLYDNAHDFTLPINAYTVQVNDFVLILDNGGPPGKGDFQIAKITGITANTLTVSGLTKPISNGSKYNIFKNGTEANVGSEAFIDNITLRSQVLSGINGRFGAGDDWSRVAIEYGVSPTIDVDKYYFIKVRGYNINPPVWGILPWITIEKPSPTPTDNEKRNAFFTVYYNSFAGAYPNGNLLIEDEFGDINVPQFERTLAPHFRPERYFLIARVLDFIPNNIESGMNEDDVFVDVHTGKIKFKTGFEPRRVYVTYHKKDEINGDSFSAEIKYKNLDNSNQINTQDKINELDNRFKKGTDIQEPSTVNGLKSYEENTFRGAYELDPLDKNSIKLVNTDDFDFFNTDDKKLVQFSGDYSDEVIDATESSVVVKHKLLKDVEDSVRNKIINSGLDVLKLSQIGLNTEDDQFIMAEDSLSSKNSIVTKEFNDSQILESSFDHNLNSGFYNLAEKVEGEYNEVLIRPHFKNTILRALMRKTAVEAVDYPLSTELQRIIKQRDAITALDKNLNKTEEVDNQIISEQYFAKYALNFNESSFNKKNFVTPYVESVDYYKYSLIANAAIQNFVVQNSNITKYDSYYSEENKKLVLAYQDPTSTPNVNELRVRVYDFTSNTLEYIEFSAADLNDDYTNATAFEIVKARVVPIDTSRFAVVYILNDALYKIHLKIYNYATGLIYTTTSPISFEGITDLGVHNDAFMDAICINESFIVVAWKKNSTESGFRIFYLENNSVSSEVTFSNDSIYENIKLLPFSHDSFVVAYSYSGSLRIKQFKHDTSLVLFGINDFSEITNNLIANGFFFAACELENNNLAFVYSETDGVDIEIFIKIFDEYSRSFGSAQKISLFSVPIGSRHKNFTAHAIDNNCFAVSYINDTNQIVNRVFQNDGQELFSRYTDASAVKTSLSSIKLTNNALLNIYVNAATSLRFDLIEFRPNLDSYNSFLGEQYQFSTLNAKGFSSVRVSENMIAIAFVADTANKDGWVVFIDQQRLNLGQSGAYTAYKFHDAAIDGDLEFHTSIISVKYVLPSNVNALGIAYTLVGGDSEVSWVDLTAAPAIIGVSSITATTNAFPTLLKLSNTRAIVAFADVATGEAQDIDLTPLNTVTTPTHGADQTFVSAAIERPYIFATETIGTTTNKVGIIYDNAGTKASLTLVNATTPVYSILNATPFDFYSSQIANISKAILSYPNLVIVLYRDFATTHLKMSIINIAVESNPTFAAAFSNPYTVEAAATSNIDVLYHDDDIVQKDYVLVTYKNVANDLVGKIINFTNLSGLTQLGSTFVIGNSSSDAHVMKYYRNHYVGFYRNTNAYARSFQSLFLRKDADDSLVYNIGDLTDQFKAFKSDTIKIAGVDFAGNRLRQIEIARSDLSNIPFAETLIDDGVFTSKISESSVSVVYFNRDLFGVIYHLHDYQANNEVKMKLFKVFNKKFYAQSGEISLGANFQWLSDPAENIYLHAQNLDKNRAVVVYRNAADGLIKKAVIDKTGGTLSGSYSNISITSPSLTPEYRVLGLKSLRNGNSIVLIYDSFENRFRTTILNSDASAEIHQSTKFEITQFSYTSGLVAKPSIDNFGNVIYYYKSGNDFKTHQHGVDGKFGATINVIGENELNNLRISKEAKFDNEVIPFSQFRKIKELAEFNAALDDIGDFKFKMDVKQPAENWPFYRLTQASTDIEEKNWPELVPYLRGLVLQDSNGVDYDLNIINYHTPDANSIILEFENSALTSEVLTALLEDKNYHGSYTNWRSVSITTGFFYLPLIEGAITNIDVLNNRITISAAENTPENVVTLLNMDGTIGASTFIDTSNNPKIWTASSGITTDVPTTFGVSEADKLQGFTSLKSSGAAGSHLSTGNTPDHDFSSGDFTISMYANLQNANLDRFILLRTNDITTPANRKYGIRYDSTFSNRRIHWMGNFGGIDIATPKETLVVESVGSNPISVAEGFGSVWTANYSSNNITRVDKTTGLTTATITLATGTNPVDLVAAGGYMWVSCNSGHVERIDVGLNTSTLWANTVGFNLYGIINHNDEIWVLQSAVPYQLRKVNMATPGFLATLNLPNWCYYGASDGDKIYLLGANTTDIYVVDASAPSIVSTWTTGPGSSSNLGILVDGDYLWVSSVSTRIIKRLNKSDGTVDATINYSASGIDPYRLTKNDKFIFASTHTSSTEILMMHKSSATKAGTLYDSNEFGSTYGIIHDGDNLWVTSYNGGTVRKIIGKGYLRYRGWTKIDVVRESGNVSIYIDRDKVVTAVDNTIYENNASMYICASDNTNSFWGNIDQLSIIKGEAKYTTASYTENTIGNAKIYPFRIAEDNKKARLFKMEANTIVTAGLNTIASLNRRDHLIKHKHPDAGHNHTVAAEHQFGGGGYGFLPGPDNPNGVIATSTNAAQLLDPSDSGTGAGTPRLSNYNEPRHTGAHAYIYGKKFVP